MTAELCPGSHQSPVLSVHERLYLHRRLRALEVSAAVLEERAAAAAHSDAASLLRRAAKNRARAVRLREYVSSSRPAVLALGEVGHPPGA